MNKHSLTSCIYKLVTLSGVEGRTTVFQKSLIILSILFSVQSFAQSGDDLIIPADQPKVKYKIWAEIVNGDTVPSIRLPEVWIYAEYTYKNKKQYEAWTRIKYNVKKVYPYAILAAAKLKEYDRVLANISDEKLKKVYLKKCEKELREEFEEPLKDLTSSQGKILLKLIDRETGKTTYDVVKTMRGGFQAFMWQGVARIFGNNMKSEYDATGEDIMVERAIKLVEAGQF